MIGAAPLPPRYSIPSEMPSSKSELKFQDYESRFVCNHIFQKYSTSIYFSVSDVWDTSIAVDSSLVDSSAEKVIRMHATGNTKNDLVMLNCNPIPSKNNKVRAMQLLATQRDPILTSSSLTQSTPLPASGIYPRLPEAGPVNRIINSSTSQPRPLESAFISCLPLYKKNLGIFIGADFSRFQRLHRMLNEDEVIDMEQLRKNCWMGIPHSLRPNAWRILSGYVPTHAARREVALTKKREEYWHFVEQYFHTRYDEQHSQTL